MVSDMIVLDKIQHAREYFKNISKSGKNNYQNYKYLECSDIFPIVRDVCREYGLVTYFKFKQGLASLRISDVQTGSSVKFNVELPVIESKDINKHMQEVGRIQTYAMRYLYIQAFEIAVADEIDSNTKSTTYNKSESKFSSKHLYESNSAPQQKLNTNKDLLSEIKIQMKNEGEDDLNEYVNNLFHKKKITADEFRDLKKKIE